MYDALVEIAVAKAIGEGSPLTVGQLRGLEPLPLAPGKTPSFNTPVLEDVVFRQCGLALTVLVDTPFVVYGPKTARKYALTYPRYLAILSVGEFNEWVDRHCQGGHAVRWKGEWRRAHRDFQITYTPDALFTKEQTS